MNNFGAYKTPEQLKAAGDTRTLDELRALARKKARQCQNCDEPEWKYGGCGLCFSCATGEADASDDMEIIP
jgi:hypothetical protein